MEKQCNGGSWTNPCRNGTLYLDQHGEVARMDDPRSYSGDCPKCNGTGVMVFADEDVAQWEKFWEEQQNYFTGRKSQLEAMIPNLQGDELYEAEKSLLLAEHKLNMANNRLTGLINYEDE